MIYQPLELRWRGYLAWDWQKLSSEVAVNYTNSYTNNQGTVIHEVDAFTTVDLRAAYDFEGLGADAVTKGLTASLQVQNVTDEDPPYVNIDGGVNFTTASPLGRTWSVTLSKKW